MIYINYCSFDSCCFNVVLDLSSVAGGLGSVLLVLVLCSGTFLILKKRKRKSGTGNILFVIIKSL